MTNLRKFYAAALSVAALGLAQGAFAAENLFFEGDMVSGQGGPGAACVLQSQFQRNEMVVWRVRVLNAGAENLGTDGITSLAVELANGEKFPMHFGEHPRNDPTDSFWATSWKIPENFPTGSLSYKVLAVDADGVEHVWQPFIVGASLLTIIEQAPSN